MRAGTRRRLQQIGWNAALDRTANYFIYGSAERHATSAL